MAKTKEELASLKQEFETLNSKIKELSDDELKQIVGGKYPDNVYYETAEQVQFIHNVGDIVEVYSGCIFGTVECTIIDRKVSWYETRNTGASGIYVANVSGYRDEYLVKENNYHWYFYLDEEWLPRNDIQI